MYIFVDPAPPRQRLHHSRRRTTPRTNTTTRTATDYHNKQRSSSKRTGHTLYHTSWYHIWLYHSQNNCSASTSSSSGVHLLTLSNSMAILERSWTLLLLSQLFFISSVMSFQRAGRLARRAVAAAPRSRVPHQFLPRVQWPKMSDLWATADNEVDPGVVAGTDLQIVKYPHPSLRETNAEISKEELKDGSIAQLAKEMFLVMYAAEGVGLAAPQVGVNKRLMVYNESGDKKRWLDEVVMVNPVITEMSDGTDEAEEACLSFPEMSGDVVRSKWIKVEALNLRGKKIKRKFSGWEARIFQHEYDHLDGTVYIDRLTEKGRADVQPRLDTLVEQFGNGGAL